MKVLYVISSSVPYGGNVALYNLLCSLIEKGIEPLVAYSSEGPFIEWLNKKAISHVKISNYYFQIYPKLEGVLDYIFFIPRLILRLKNLKAEYDLDAIVKDFKPQLIHTNLGPIHIGYKVAKKHDIPHVWHIREYQDLDFKMNPFPSKKSFISKLYQSNPVVITKDIFNHFTLKENRAQVIYDGVMKYSRTQFLDKKEKYFLFVGRIEEAKGIDFLIDVFSLYLEQNNEYKLYIAGNGQSNYVAYIKNKVKQCRYPDNIIFLGYRDDRYELMARATATIVPSVSEGFGFITVEAMFNGCLVIGRNTGGTKEILEKDNLGLLFSSKEELLDHMLNVTDQGVSSFYPKILKAQKYASELYSIETHGEKVYKYYMSILSRNEKDN